MSRASFTLRLLTIFLGGCSFLSLPAPVTNAPLAQQNINKLLQEAHRLANKVKNGEFTRVEAANQLNRVRLRVVGVNAVDNATFATYRYLAQCRDDGTISQKESHARMEQALRDWQDKWPTLSPRPDNPAFTNFLLQVYGLPSLGQETPASH